MTNQSKKLEALTNKDDDQKLMFNNPAKERFDKIIELTDEINQTT